MFGGVWFNRYSFWNVSCNKRTFDSSFMVTRWDYRWSAFSVMYVVLVICWQLLGGLLCYTKWLWPVGSVYCRNVWKMTIWMTTRRLNGTYVRFELHQLTSVSVLIGTIWSYSLCRLVSHYFSYIYRNGASVLLLEFSTKINVLHVWAFCANSRLVPDREITLTERSAKLDCEAASAAGLSLSHFLAAEVVPRCPGWARSRQMKVNGESPRLSLITTEAKICID